MKRPITEIVLMSCAVWLAFGQSSGTAPKFEVADVHPNTGTMNRYFRIPPMRGGRYELKNATIVDLIRTAYDFDADKIFGGPS
jgi:hypothetical protein